MSRRANELASVLGGWTCNLTWVASDACYEVAAFWAKKNRTVLNLPPPGFKRVSPKLVFWARAPCGLSLIHHPSSEMHPSEPSPDNIGSVMDKKRKITESNNEEPAQPEAAASNPMISPSVNFNNNTITMSPQMSNNQTSSSNDPAYPAAPI